MNWIDPTVIRVLLGAFFIGLAATLVGTFTFLQKRALVGDAISHAILPGVVLAYWCSGERQTWILLLGALVAGWLSTMQMDWILRKTKLKSDAAIASVLSTFFSFGLVGLSLLQARPDDAQSGLGDFLFGKIAAVSTNDVWLFGIISITITCSIVWKFKILVGIAFNSEFIEVKGFSIRKNSFLFTSLTILAIAIGIQAVGVVLMSALLIVPVVCARMLTFRIIPLVFIAIVIGVCSSILGAFISMQSSHMPTGPWIIAVLSGFMLLAASWRWKNERANRMKNG